MNGAPELLRRPNHAFDRTPESSVAFGSKFLGGAGQGER